MFIDTCASVWSELSTVVFVIHLYGASSMNELDKFG